MKGILSPEYALIAFGQVGYNVFFKIKLHKFHNKNSLAFTLVYI
jgi:hypothetical protein